MREEKILRPVSRKLLRWLQQKRKNTPGKVRNIIEHHY